MKKRFLTKGICLVLSTGMILSMAGCGKKDNQSDTQESTMVKESTMAANNDVKETTTEATTKADEPTSRKGTKILSMQEIQALDNTRVNWGSGGETDENNVPTGCNMYQEKYGKYNADFVREKKGKKIFLTFDEGYENGYTSKILDTLKEKNVKAVFFVTMPYVKEQPKLIKRMIKEGHIVGSHSVTHPSNGMVSLSLKEQQNEMNKLHDYVSKKFDGYDMKLFRYPAGIFSTQSLALMQSLGYTSVFWSFAYYDYDVNNQLDHATALKKIESSLHPGGIFLLHAVSKTNAEILGQLIDDIRQKGYQIERYY